MRTEKISSIEELRLCQTGEVIRLVRFEGSKHHKLLDFKLLRQLIPKYSDLNQAAQGKALKKLLDGVKSRRYKLNLDLPPFGRKVAKKLKGISAPEQLSVPARAILGLLEFFENSTAGAYLLAHILLSFHADKLRERFQDLPALEFRGVPGDLLEAIKAVFHVVAPSRKISTHGLKLVRTPIADLRGDGLTLPTSLDLSWVKVKGKRGTKTAVRLVNTPVLLIGASGRNPKGLADSLRNVPVTSVNLSTRLNNGACSSFTLRDLHGFDPQVVKTITKQTVGIRCLLLLWWACDEVELHPADEASTSRYRHFLELDINQLAQLYEAVLHSFIEFLATNCVIAKNDAERYHEHITQLFHPHLVDEAEMTPPTFDDPDVFLAVIKDIVSQNSGRIMEFNEKRQPGKKPIGGWRSISNELFLVVLEEEVERLYPKLAEAHGVPASDFQRSNWLADLLKAMGQAGMLKMPTKGFHYTYDLVGRGRDRTKVLAIRSELVAGEKSEDTDTNISHNPPAISPNDSNGNSTASH